MGWCLDWPNTLGYRKYVSGKEGVLLHRGLLLWNDSLLRWTVCYHCNNVAFGYVLLLQSA